MAFSQAKVSAYILLEVASLFQVNAQTHVVVGDAKERICEAVEKLHADTLVMGSRAFGPIKRYEPRGDPFVFFFL